MAIVLRQEIHVANLTRSSVELTAMDCGIDESLDPAADLMWYLRIMAHTARLTNYAYGGEARSIDAWDAHSRYLEDWDRAKPSTMNPINGDLLQTSINSASFPTIYYVNDCAIAGRQYLEVCRILLLANNPRTPTLGLGRRSHIIMQEEAIRRSVRTICGIWLSNQGSWHGRVPAGLAIGMTGELFTDPGETARLLDIVTQAETHVVWPCLRLKQALRVLWGLH